MLTNPAPIIPDAVIEAIGGLFIAIASAIVGWHLRRPKEKAETKHENASAEKESASAADVVTDAAGKAVKLLSDRLDEEIEARKKLEKKYQTMLDELKKTYETQIKQLQDRVDALEAENARLKRSKGGMINGD